MNGLFVFWYRKAVQRYGKNFDLINNFNSDQFRQRNGFYNHESELKQFQIYFEILLSFHSISLLVLFTEKIINLLFSN